MSGAVRYSDAADGGADHIADRALPVAPLQTVVLTNTMQAPRFAAYVPDHAPDPAAEYRLLAQCGINQSLRDLNRPPLNPWARSGNFYAGIDAARALRVLLADRKAHAVLCVFENTALVLLALRKLFGFRPPILLYEVSERGWWPRDRVLDFVMPRVDLVMTLTRQSKAYAERSYRLKRRAIVVGYSVGTEFYHPDASGASPVHGGYILSVGDDHSRDYGTLLAACAELDTRVVIRTRRSVAIPDAMRGRVTVLRERQSYRQLRDLYRGARLVALPLRPADNPGGITTLFEAMAMGKAVVCTGTGSTLDFVADGQNALVVEPGSPSALREAIRRVLNDTAFAGRLGRAARAYAESSLSKAAFAARMAAAIRSIRRG